MIIKVVDPDNVLTPAERDLLSRFIPDQCMATTKELSFLKHVKIKKAPGAGYSGYWSAKFITQGADVRIQEAVIVLNSHYLKTLDQMKRTLAHEYGHHWTLFFLMDRYEMTGWFAEPSPKLYYRIRGLDPNIYAKDYSKSWGKCDKEVMAEDYKHLFSPYKNSHRMADEVQNPIFEVAQYFERLGNPPWN